MIKYIVLALLAIIIPLDSIGQSRCFEGVNKIYHIVCFGDDLEYSLAQHGIPWAMEKEQDAYEAITYVGVKDSMLVSVTAFREEVAVGTISHEVSHVAEHLGLDGERRADYIGNHTATILNTALYFDVPVYVILGGERQYLKLARNL